MPCLPIELTNPEDMSVAMQESQRLAYLQELGVQPYFPRRVLPGAKASLRYSVESLGAAQARKDALQTTALYSASLAPRMESAVPAASPASAETIQAGLDQARALMAPDVKQVAEPKNRTVEPQKLHDGEAKQQTHVSERLAQTEPAIEHSGDTDVNFVFAYFAISENVAVVNELPWAGSGQVSAEHKNLLANILNAISVPCTPDSLAPMLFRWPIEGMPDVLEAQGARNMLEGFMARRLKVKPAKYLLVLAEQSSQYLFPKNHVDNPNAVGFESHPRLPCEVLVTRSLDAMMASRQVKSVVWAALQPLKTLIESSAASQNNSI